MQSRNPNENGGRFELTNAATAKAFGLELNGELAITDRLIGTAQAALEHSDYSSFPNFSTASRITLQSVVINATGNELPRAPKQVYTAGLAYSHDVAAAGTIRGPINAYYNSGFSGIRTTPRGRMPMPSSAPPSVTSSRITL